MRIEELGKINSFCFFVKLSRSTDTMLLTGIVLMFYVPDWFILENSFPDINRY